MLTRRNSAMFVVTLCMALVVSSCSGVADVAQAHQQFCDDVESYVVSIDEYGGLFQDADLTVGDVKNASEELEPGLETVTESAQEFQDAVAADTENGVDIEVVDPGSIQAVQQAQVAFTQASDISDDTRLVEAGVDFSSAAYQLEVAWVRLFVDAGCLAGDSEAQAEAQQWVSDYVSAIQADLRAIGYYSGGIDGIYGPSTIEAVEQFQEDEGLTVTGLVDPPTQAALQMALGDQESAQVGALQAILISTGNYDGPVDGQWSPAVEDGLKSLQEELGVPATGVVDAATLKAFEQALVDAGEPPTLPTLPTLPPATTVPPPDVTTTTAAPATTSTTAAVTTTTTRPVITGGVLDVLAEAGEFTEFLAAVEAAGLTETLSGPGPFTIFAPTDEALAGSPLPSEPDVLAAVVLYHVIEDDLDGFELQSLESVVSAQGGEIEIGVDQGVTVLNQVSVVTITNVLGSNGVAHVTNAPLGPPIG